jgi:DNA-binding CsgD family transcriptional regulator
MYERCRALVAAGRGDPVEADRWAELTIARAEATGNRWDELDALRALGTASLLAHDPARAAERLRAVWAHTQREGVDEPGVFPVAPELVEALTELGEHDDARAVTERLARLAEEQQHPWARAALRRCEGLSSPGGSELGEAAAAYGALGLRFDRARTLLLLGRAERRRKKWAAARSALEAAVTELDELGSPGWAEEARSELARVGARRPAAAGRLTPTEQRVVDLAAAGLSNKEIARTLVVTVNTVETHLSHAYAKLGVRSRGQLAARLVDGA